MSEVGMTDEEIIAAMDQIADLRDIIGCLYTCSRTCGCDACQHQDGCMVLRKVEEIVAEEVGE